MTNTTNPDTPDSSATSSEACAHCGSRRPLHDLDCPVTTTPAPQAATTEQADDRIAQYVPGQWFEARTLDEMQAFYMSRLPVIREAAKEHGYAIGLHGSTRRDFDLMAMQWRDDASDKDTLAHAIAVAACGITRDGAFQWEQKPSGRFAVSLPICWTDHGNPDFKKPSMGHIDLSVIDIGASPATAVIKTWQQRMKEAGKDVRHGVQERYPFLGAEIADLRAALAGREAAPLDERALFKTWLEKDWPMLTVDFAPLNGFYKGDDGACIQDKWEGWQARAALSQPAAPVVDGGLPPLPEQQDSGAVYGIIDPDYGRIYTMVRKLAWEEGYAIGLHGSFTRDLDMIAVPWDDGRRCDPEKLVRRIVAATGLREQHGNPGIKPHGRKVWTLLLPEFGDPRFVDLSIMPAAARSAPVGLPDGWKITRAGDAITIEQPAVGKAVTHRNASDPADVILYHLAETLLAAAPSHPEPAGGKDGAA